MKKKYVIMSIFALCASLLAGCQQAAAGGAVIKHNEETKTLEAESPATESCTAALDVAEQDGREMEEMVTDFYTAYFGGDADAIKQYLTNPYLWDIEVYGNPSSDVEISAIRGLDNREDKCVASVEYKEPGADCYFYLTIILIRTEEGWKVQFYGIEG